MGATKVCATVSVTYEHCYTLFRKYSVILAHRIAFYWYNIIHTHFVRKTFFPDIRLKQDSS